MQKNILSELITKYQGLKVDNRIFIRVNGYACTVYYINNMISVSFELPLLSKSSVLICDICNSIGYACEYNYPSLNIAIEQTDALSVDSICDILENATKLYIDNGIRSDICIKCHEATAEYFNVNGYYCPIHRDCANKILSAQNDAPAETHQTRIKGILVGSSFAFFGSLSYILFALLGIMPAFGGILMGVLAALGYRLFSKNIHKADKAILWIVFLIFAVFSNFTADYVYAMTINAPLDFMATYSDPLNLFSTAFDVLAGSIISVCSMSLVTDFDRRASAATIKKIPSVKRPDTSDVDPSKENNEDQ